MKRREYFPTHSMQPAFTDTKVKHFTRKVETNILSEHRCQNSGENVSQVANGIQHTKRIIHHDQVAFIPGVKRRSNTWKPINVIHHINKLKKENITNTLKEHLTKSNILSWYELSTLGIQKTSSPQHGASMDSYSSQHAECSRDHGQACPPHHLLTSAKRWGEKENVFYHRCMTSYAENPMGSTHICETVTLKTEALLRKFQET